MLDEEHIRWLGHEVVNRYAWPLESHLIRIKDINWDEVPQELKDMEPELQDRACGRYEGTDTNPYHAGGGDGFWMEDYGDCIGIAKHPKLGYFLLGCGQGPCVLWCEYQLNSREDIKNFEKIMVETKNA